METESGRGQKGLHKTRMEAERAVSHYYWRLEKMRLIYILAEQ